MDKSMDDINKFEHSMRKVDGCANGKHQFDEREGHSTVEVDGDLTKIKMKCLLCGKQIDISAPLDLNRFIGRQEETAPQNTPQIQRTEQPTNNSGQSDILKRLLR